jgi:GTPase Era involved in 16S rRNA processing
MDIHEGDIIMISDKEDDGWSYGYNYSTGKGGLVPQNYLEKCENIYCEEEEKSEGPYSEKELKDMKMVYIAVQNVKGDKKKKHLLLREGDLVTQVQETDDPEMWSGNVRKPNNEILDSGRFPKNAIVLEKIENIQKRQTEAKKQKEMKETQSKQKIAKEKALGRSQVSLIEEALAEREKASQSQTNPKIKIKTLPTSYAEEPLQSNPLPIQLPIQKYTDQQQMTDMNRVLIILKASIDHEVKEKRLNDAHAKILEKNLNKLQEEVQRDKPIGTDFREVNILLVGKTRAGKTTVAKMIQNLFQIVKSASMFVGTVNTNITQVEIRYNNINYRINFIDTPGLFELTPSEEYNKGGPKRDNETLLKLIRQDLLQSGLTVHAVFFCFTGELEEGGQDAKALELYLHNFPNVPWIAVYTRAEGLLPKDIKDLRKQLKEHPNEFIQNHDIYFAGALPDPTSLPIDEIDPKQSLRYLNNIAQYRKDILKYIAKIKK